MSQRNPINGFKHVNQDFENDSFEHTNPLFVCRSSLIQFCPFFIHCYGVCSCTIADQLSCVWKTEDFGFPRLFLGNPKSKPQCKLTLAEQSGIYVPAEVSVTLEISLLMLQARRSAFGRVSAVNSCTCTCMSTHTHMDHMFNLPCDWTPVQEHYLFKATKSGD